jgi:hypothetical protein
MNAIESITYGKTTFKNESSYQEIRKNNILIGFYCEFVEPDLSDSHIWHEDIKGSVLSFDELLRN